MQNQNRSILITGTQGAGKNTILGSIQVMATREKFHMVTSSNFGVGITFDPKVFDTELAKWQESTDCRKGLFPNKYLHVLVCGSFLKHSDTKCFDTVICVCVSEDEQRARLREQGLSSKSVDKIIEEQTPYLMFASVPGAYVLDTTGISVDSPIYKEHLDSIWGRVKGLTP